MSFTLRMGLPEMEGLWKELLSKHESGALKGPDKPLFKKMVKTFRLLAVDPRHNSLQSHEISELSRGDTEKRCGNRILRDSAIGVRGLLFTICPALQSFP